MAPLRRKAAQRPTIALLLALSLLVALFVPTGWMPASDGAGFRLVPCPAYAPAMPMVMSSMAGDGTHAMHHGKDEHGKSDANQPCAFGGLSSASLDGGAVPYAFAPAPRPELAPPALTEAIGRGLAAPPPPATGPPSNL